MNIIVLLYTDRAYLTAVFEITENNFERIAVQFELTSFKYIFEELGFINVKHGTH